MMNKGPFLKVGEYLAVDDYIVSKNGKFFLIMQTDGNLVMYEGPGPQNQGRPRWATNTYRPTPQSRFVIMQADGNLVMYEGPGPQNQGRPLWSSNSANHFIENHLPELPCFTTLEDNGNLCVYEAIKTFQSNNE